MSAALLTMLVGVLGAIAQTDIKRMLTFTLVSHIGYMVFGSRCHRGRLAAAVFYVVHHITVQTSLFLVTGLIERRGGRPRMDRARRAGQAAPISRCCSSSRR